MEEARAWFEEGTRTLEGAASVALWQVSGATPAVQKRECSWGCLYMPIRLLSPDVSLLCLPGQAWAVLEAKQGDATAVRYLFKRALGVNPRSR